MMARIKTVEHSGGEYIDFAVTMNHPTPAREIELKRRSRVAYSICSLVTNVEEYNEMVASFISGGFTSEDCEFLYIDNSRGNKADAYMGYNEFLSGAQGDYIILCHQDILLKFDRRPDLERQIAAVEAVDPAWGLLGNAGGNLLGMAAGRVSHPLVESSPRVHQPWAARSLDENFILVRRRANLGVSRDLQGFHFYGTDICTIARIMGWSAWVVDFHLFHKSTGSFSEAFYTAKREVEEKYRAAMAGHFVQTTCAAVALGGCACQQRSWDQQERKLRFKEIYDARRRRRSPDGNAAENGKKLPALSEGWYAYYWLERKLTRPIENLARAIRRLRRPRSRILRPDPVFIIGMHRSGTSALGGALEPLGLSAGKTVMPPDAATGNPKGYYENLSVVQFHDRFLTAINSTWMDIEPLRRKRFRGKVTREFREELLPLLEVEFGAQRALIKDPRLCRLIPLWRPLVKGLFPRAHFLLPIRHPVEVAYSLQKRDAMPLQQGLRLWAVHVLEGEWCTRGFRRTFTTYDELIASPDDTVARLAKTLDLSREKVQAEASGQVDPALRHHTGLSWPAGEADGELFLAIHQALISNDPKKERVLDRLRGQYYGQMGWRPGR
jgi:hypothetical protein